jgi:hypothetical protein
MHRLGNFHCRGGRTYRRIDRILTALSARQGGEREHMRLIEAGKGVNARHGQFVLSQGAGFVGTQHVHGYGLIDHARIAVSANGMISVTGIFRK